MLSLQVSAQRSPSQTSPSAPFKRLQPVSPPTSPVTWKPFPFTALAFSVTILYSLSASPHYSVTYTRGKMFCPLLCPRANKSTGHIVGVWIIYCLVKKITPKCRSLQQQHLLSCSDCGSGMWMQVSGSPLGLSHKAAMAALSSEGSVARTGFKLTALLTAFSVLQFADWPQFLTRLLAKVCPPFPGTRASPQSVSHHGSWPHHSE